MRKKLIGKKNFLVRLHCSVGWAVCFADQPDCRKGRVIDKSRKMVGCGAGRGSEATLRYRNSLLGNRTQAEGDREEQQPGQGGCDRSVGRRTQPVSGDPVRPTSHGTSGTVPGHPQHDAERSGKSPGDDRQVRRFQSSRVRQRQYSRQ